MNKNYTPHDYKFAKALQESLAQDVQVEKQLTPSIGLNFALRGGLGYGRQVLVWGIVRDPFNIRV